MGELTLRPAVSLSPCGHTRYAGVHACCPRALPCFAAFRSTPGHPVASDRTGVPGLRGMPLAPSVAITRSMSSSEAGFTR